MAQMNPLIGPKLDNVTLLVMAREWVSDMILKIQIVGVRADSVIKPIEVQLNNLPLFFITGQ